MSLFSCSGCVELIPAHKARVQCQTCGSELCANCYVVQKFSQTVYALANGHLASHATLLFNQSGFAPATVPGLMQNQQTANTASPANLQTVGSPPIGFAQQQTPAVVASPQHQSSPVYQQNFASPQSQAVPSGQTFSSPQGQQAPVPAGYQSPPAQQYASPPIYSGPQEAQKSPAPGQSQPPPVQASTATPQPPSASHQPYPAPQAQQSPPVAGYQTFSPNQQLPSNGGYQPPSRDAQAPNTATPFVWQPLFDHCTPTETYNSLINAIFTHLDPQQSGFLSPEVYSSFLDVQGYELQHDVWKKSLTPVFGQNTKDIADFELKQAYDNFSIEYVLRPRNEPRNNDMAQMTSSFAGLMGSAVQSIVNAAAPASVSGGQMPMITRKGFLDITAVEMLYDPSKGWGNLNRALQAYGIWRERGPVPRTMLPEIAPPEVIQRVQTISVMAQNKAQQMLAAKQAELRLKQQGQQAALDLLDDRRYYYTYG